MNQESGSAPSGPGLLRIIGPGVLVAATGVGAGDLATGAFSGAELGVAVLWVVLVGAALKYLLSEGLARFQLVTGETLLEGAARRFGPVLRWLFLLYLLTWSFFVGLALMSACGVCAHALVPILDPVAGKIVFALAHSAGALLLLRLSGFRRFEQVMKLFVAIMFVVVLATAVALRPSLSSIVRGMVWPSIPDLGGAGLEWSLALMGGVGGTLTVLCYGYWIREAGRVRVEQLSICRLDLLVGYGATALFGMAMVVIGSGLGGVEGSGASLIVRLADQLERTLGAFGGAARWMFLVGAWCAVFSSLLGVWQSVPYLFADFLRASGSGRAAVTAREVSTSSRPYRVCQWALAFVPALGLWVSFVQAQKLYAIIGALFLPLLALALLILNGRFGPLPPRHRNSRLSAVLLALTLLTFLWAGWYQIAQKLGF